MLNTARTIKTIGKIMMKMVYEILENINTVMQSTRSIVSTYCTQSNQVQFAHLLQHFTIQYGKVLGKTIRLHNK